MKLNKHIICAALLVAMAFGAAAPAQASWQDIVAEVEENVTTEGVHDPPKCAEELLKKAAKDAGKKGLEKAKDQLAKILDPKLAKRYGTIAKKLPFVKSATGAADLLGALTSDNPLANALKAAVDIASGSGVCGPGTPLCMVAGEGAKALIDACTNIGPACTELAAEAAKIGYFAPIPGGTAIAAAAAAGVAVLIDAFGDEGSDSGGGEMMIMPVQTMTPSVPDDFPLPIPLVNPPQEPGSDIPCVTVAGQSSTRRLLAHNCSDIPVDYPRGRTFEPRDGGFQRMIVTADTTIPPGATEAIPVACRQLEKALPATGLRYFSRSKVTSGSVGACQVACLSGGGDVQDCVWDCQNPPGN